MAPSTRLLALALVAAILPSTVLAQGWRQIAGGGPGAARCGLAYDEERGELVRYGGPGIFWPYSHQQLVAFDGVRWVHRPSPQAPTLTGRDLTPMVFDPVRRTVLMCVFATMWEWDGVSWVALPSAQQPAGGTRVLAFDRARGRTVSIHAPFQASETWEWDATNGWQLASNTVPGVICAATFVPTRGRVVGVTDRDLWEWTGTAWTLLAGGVLPLPPPSQIPGRTAAWDSWRQRLVIVDTHATPVRVCEWDGNTVTTFAPVIGPRPRLEAALVFDPSRGQTVLAGGEMWGLAEVSDTWAWDGVAWQELAVAPNAGRPWLAYDWARSRMVATGSAVWVAAVSDTLEDDGLGWQRRTLGSSSVDPLGPIVFDSVRGEVLQVSAVTRRWNGVAWSNGVPSPPIYGALAFDAARGEVVMFGEVMPVGQTWLWNGTAWRQAQPALSPAGRDGHAMVYDPVRQRVVLFGGAVGISLLGDTWEWDGITWQQMSPTTAPGARSGHAMAFDWSRGAVVTTGGSSLGGGAYPTWWPQPLEPWVWDGSNWTHVSVPGAPRLVNHAMDFDPTRWSLVVQGGVSPGAAGQGPSVATSDTLVLVGAPLPRIVAGAGTCGPGVAAPRLRPESEPFLGAAFRVHLLTQVPSSLGALALASSLTSIPVGNGCRIELANPVNFVLVTTNAGGAATIPLPVPYDLALLGVTVFAQGGMFDPASGLLTSNHLALTVGN